MREVSSWNKKVTLQKRLRTFASAFGLPFTLLGSLLKDLLITRSSWPDMECQGMNDHRCGLFTDPDCSKCSFYEPKEAYRGVGR